MTAEDLMAELEALQQVAERLQLALTREALRDALQWCRVEARRWPD